MISDSDNIDSYLDSIIADSNNVISYQKEMKVAALLISVGKHQEAIHHFEEAHQMLMELKDDPDYDKLYFGNSLRYAWCLEYLGDLTKAEEMYLEALPGGGLAIGDYANFLHRKKSDFTLAKRYYKMAIDLFPSHSSLHLKYAGFLRHIEKDLVGAEHHYKLAVETNPSNSDAIGNYASYLHGISKNHKEAEFYYEKAIKVDQTHTNNHCNYGLYLSEIKKEYPKAEIMYKKALEYHPTHANTLYNYAVMLDTHCDRKEEAEVLYKKSIEIETNHPFALYNLAVLLEEKLKTKDQLNNLAITNEKDLEDQSHHEARLEIAEYYKRATNSDPYDAVALADYGRYILVGLKDKEKAETILNRALQMNPRSEVALYSLGLLHFRYANELNISQDFFRRLLKLNPRHSSAMHQLANVLLQTVNKLGKSSPERIEEIIKLYQNCIENSKNIQNLMIEYCKILSVYGSNKQKVDGLSFVSFNLNKVEYTKDVENAINNLKSKV